MPRPYLQFLHYPSARSIRWHQRHAHAIANQHPDEIPVYRLAQVRDDFVPAIELHFRQLAGQKLDYHPLGFHKTKNQEQELKNKN